MTELEKAESIIRETLEKIFTSENIPWSDRHKFLNYKIPMIAREINNIVTIKRNLSIFEELVRKLKAHPSLKKSSIKMDRNTLRVSFEGISNYYAEVIEDRNIYVINQSNKYKSLVFKHDEMENAINMIVNHVGEIWTEKLLGS